MYHLYVNIYIICIFLYDYYISGLIFGSDGLISFEGITFDFPTMNIFIIIDLYNGSQMK